MTERGAQLRSTWPVLSFAGWPWIGNYPKESGRLEKTGTGFLCSLHTVVATVQPRGYADAARTQTLR